MSKLTHIKPQLGTLRNKLRAPRFIPGQSPVDTTHKPWANQGSRHKRGYGSAWDKLRKVILQRDNHLCQPCAAKGTPTPADAVDHIQPKAQGGTDDHDNLQAICTACHDAKTERERDEALGRKPRPTIGLDGWPVE